MSKPLTAEQVKHLRSVVNRMGHPHTDAKTALLEACSAGTLTEVGVTREYHDCLLFLLAYPDNDRIHALATAELERVTAAIRMLAEGNNNRKRRQLYGSGMEHTIILSSFSFEIVQWLCRNYPGNMELYSLDGEHKTSMDILKMLLPKAEHDTLTKKNLSIQQWMETLRGADPSTLQWLIRSLEALPCTPYLRGHLYNSLNVFVSITLESPLPSRTTARSINRPVFFHTTELTRKVDAATLLAEPVEKPITLAAKQKDHLLTVQRAMLLALFRETDPVTLANPDETMLFDLGRGITVSLTCMKPERRFAFESYIGYMAFKNGLPISYGGGWIFGNRSRIGVNIFAPYRGGESAYLFCQVLRLYHQYFGVSSFAVDPYQVGKNNSEGLKSGAFWFYYRLGFRPQQEKLAKLAANEFNKITLDRSYHSPLNVLKQLSNAVMQLDLDQVPLHTEPAGLSEAVTRFVGAAFAGDRERAKSVCMKQVLQRLDADDVKAWTADEREAFAQQALLVAQVEGVQQWNAAEKKTLIDVMRSKGSGSEVKYVHALLKHKKWHAALSAFIKK